MPVGSEPPKEGQTFTQLLAERAEENKPQLVAATLQAFQEGEPSAIKLVTQALLESRFKEEDNDLINDEKFFEIIRLIADNSRAAKD